MCQRKQRDEALKCEILRVHQSNCDGVYGAKKVWKQLNRENARVADLTYVKTHIGWVYVAFIIDVFSRFIVGWQISTSLRSDLAIDALEMAIYGRNGNDLSELIHHSDRGVQYLSIRYSEPLSEAEIVASVGSKGDSYDNALAKSFNGLYKTELIHRQGPWRNIEHVQWATLNYVDWFNNRRIHESLDYVSPVEFELSIKEEKTA